MVRANGLFSNIIVIYIALFIVNANVRMIDMCIKQEKVGILVEEDGDSESEEHKIPDEEEEFNITDLYRYSPVELHTEFQCSGCICLLSEYKSHVVHLSTPPPEV